MPFHLTCRRFERKKGTMEKHYNLLEVANGKPIKHWTQGVPVEDDARKQLINTAKMPFIFKHLAVMPDVHLGKGSTIGSVIPTVGAIEKAVPHGRSVSRGGRDKGAWEDVPELADHAWSALAGRFKVITDKYP